MRATQESSGPGKELPVLPSWPSSEAPCGLGHPHPPRTSLSCLGAGRAGRKDSLCPAPSCHPEPGMQVNVATPRSEACSHDPYLPSRTWSPAEPGAHLASRLTPCRNVELLSRSVHTPCSSRVRSSSSLLSFRNKSCMDLIVILEEGRAPSGHGFPAGSTHRTSDR